MKGKRKSKGKEIHPKIAGTATPETVFMKKKLGLKTFGVWAFSGCVKDSNTGDLPLWMTYEKFAEYYNKSWLGKEYGQISERTVKHAFNVMKSFGLAAQSSVYYVKPVGSGAKSLPKPIYAKKVYGSWVGGQCTIPVEALSAMSASHNKWGGKRKGAGRPKGSKSSPIRKPKISSENQLVSPVKRGSENQLVSSPSTVYGNQVVSVKNQVVYPRNSVKKDENRNENGGLDLENQEIKIVHYSNSTNRSSNSKDITKVISTAPEARSGFSNGRVDLGEPADTDEGRAMISRWIPKPPTVEYLDIPTLPDPPLLDPNFSELEQVYALASAYTETMKARFGKPCYKFKKFLKEKTPQSTSYFSQLSECADMMHAFDIAPFAWIMWRTDHYVYESSRKRLKEVPIEFIFVPSLIDKHKSWFSHEAKKFKPRTPCISTQYRKLLATYDEFCKDWEVEKQKVKTVGDAKKALAELWNIHFPDGVKEAYGSVRREAQTIRRNLHERFNRGENVWIRTEGE